MGEAVKGPETSRRRKPLKQVWHGRPVDIEFGYQRRDGKKSFRRILLNKVLEDDEEHLYLLGFCSKRQRDRVFSLAGLTTKIRFHGENYDPEEFISEMLIGGKAAFMIREEAAEESGWLWPTVGTVTVVLLALAGGGYWYYSHRDTEAEHTSLQDLAAGGGEFTATNNTAVGAADARIPIVDDNTVNDFIYRYAQDYVEMGMKLLDGYYRFEKNHDFDGFESFKTMEWMPEYQAKQMYYNAVQERNWEFMFYHGLTQLTADFMEMIPSSNDLWFSLKNLDEAKLAVVRNRFLRVKVTLEELDKKRGLNLGEVLAGLRVR